MPRFLLLLALFWAILYLPGLGDPEIRGEEGRRIQPAQTMLQSGDWLLPRVSGEIYLRKPPLVNWLIALSIKATGRDDELAYRLPSALCALLLALGALILLHRRIGLAGAATTSVLILTNISTFEQGRLAEIEMLYICCTGLALFLWASAWHRDANPWILWLPPAFFLGLGLLAKGPLHLLYFLAVVLSVLVAARQLRRLLHPAFALSLLLSAAMLVLWAVPAARQAEKLSPRPSGASAQAENLPASPSNASATAVWTRQLVSRLTGEDFDLSNWLLNIPNGLKNFLPWALLLPLAWLPSAIEPLRRHPRSYLLFIGLRSGLLIGFILVSLLPGVRPRYTLPLVIPATSLLLGLLLSGGLPPVPAWLGLLWRRALFVPAILALLLGPALVVASQTYILPHAGPDAARQAWICGLLAFLAGGAALFRLLHRPPGIRIGHPEDLQTLLLGTLLVLPPLIPLYVGGALPLAALRDDVRPVARQIRTLFRPGETLQTLNPGPQPIFTYLDGRLAFPSAPEHLPSDARLLLVPQKDLPDLLPRLPRPIVSKPLTYRDAGGKTFLILELAPASP